MKTGKVYFVYRDFPLISIHPGALLAAHVANCAADQGAFWPMHGRIFRGYELQEWGRGSTDLPVFLGYASELNLDPTQLRQCVETSKHGPRITRDYREASELGVRSTPTFLVNGQLVIGARPFDDWKRMLDGLLAQSR